MKSSAYKGVYTTHLLRRQVLVEDYHRPCGDTNLVHSDPLPAFDSFRTYHLKVQNAPVRRNGIQDFEICSSSHRPANDHMTEERAGDPIQLARQYC